MKMHYFSMEQLYRFRCYSCDQWFSIADPPWNLKIIGCPSCFSKGTLCKPGEKVKYNGKIYDFGYLEKTGKAIICEEGECNIRDAIAVDVKDLEIV